MFDFSKFIRRNLISFEWLLNSLEFVKHLNTIYWGNKIFCEFRHRGSLGKLNFITTANNVANLRCRLILRNEILFMADQLPNDSVPPSPVPFSFHGSIWRVLKAKKMNFVNIYFQNWIKRCWCWKFNKNDFNWVFNNIFPSRRVGLCFTDPCWSQITLLASSSKSSPPVRADNPHEFWSCLRRHSPSN